MELRLLILMRNLSLQQISFKQDNVSIRERILLVLKNAYSLRKRYVC
jgi:hypothetical protein